MEVIALGVLPLAHQMVELLNREQINAIHEASMRILEKVGVVFEDKEACRIFADAGAEVSGSSVKIPRKIVEKTLKNCPDKFTLYAREKDYDVELGTGKIYYTNGFGTTITEDLETGIYRPAELEDLKNYIRLADSLENVHYCLHQVYPSDIKRWKDVSGGYNSG